MRLAVISDLHLRSDKPRCRLDPSFRETQEKQLRFIYTSAVEQGAAGVIIAGDIYHRPHEEDWLKTMFLEVLNDFPQLRTSIMPGQHDLPKHSWSLLKSSSFGVLWEIASKHPYLLRIEDNFDWCLYGSEEIRFSKKGKSDILVLHRLVTPPGKEIPFKEDCISAEKLLQKYPKYKFILAGDYHHGFIYEEDKRFVIVPGCMNRQASDMISYTPSWTLIDTEALTAQRFPIPDDTEFVTDVFVREQERRESDLEAFVEATKTTTGVSLDYEQNVREAKRIARIGAEVSLEVDRIMELAHERE